MLRKLVQLTLGYNFAKYFFKNMLEFAHASSKQSQKRETYDHPIRSSDFMHLDGWHHAWTKFIRNFLNSKTKPQYKYSFQSYSHWFAQVRMESKIKPLIKVTILTNDTIISIQTWK